MFLCEKKKKWQIGSMLLISLLALLNKLTILAYISEQQHASNQLKHSPVLKKSNDLQEKVIKVKICKNSITEKKQYRK